MDMPNNSLRMYILNKMSIANFKETEKKFRTYSNDAQKFIFDEFQQTDDDGMNNYKKSAT